MRLWHQAGWLAARCWSRVEDGVEEGVEERVEEGGLKLVGGSVVGRCAQALVLGDSRR